jgi:hypothetical protein
MTADPDSPLAPSKLPLYKRISYAGVAILIAGLAAAALIYVFAADDAGRERDAEIANYRAYEYRIERVGGMATVYVVRFNQWLGTLWQGRRLAYTTGALSIVIALLCLAVARMVYVRSGPDDDREIVRSDPDADREKPERNV